VTSRDLVAPAPPATRRRPGRPLRVGARYLFAIAVVVLANAVTYRIQTAMGESISPLFFAAVALAAGYGGAGPGLLATGLAGVLSAIFYENPPGMPLFWWDDLVRVLVFLMVAMLISSLAHRRRRAVDDLRRANDGLEHRVRERTAELERSTRLVRESEERFRALVDGVSDHAMCMLDRDGRVIGWNAGAERTLGYTRGQVDGRSFAQFYPPEARERGEPADHLRRAATAGRDEDEGWRVRGDGTRFWANAVLTPLHGEALGDSAAGAALPRRPAPPGESADGDAAPRRGFALVVRDITEVKRLEKEVLEASEAEQRRIGQDLHDGLGQELTGLSFLTQNLRRRLADAGRGEAAEADRIAGLIARTIDQTRELARGLSPVEWGSDGLSAALRNLAATVRATYGVPCTAACDADARVEDHVAAVHLYRIAQEALTNAARHAGASAIELGLAADGDDLILTISDNGMGLAPTADRAPGRGLGLRLMQYRARSIDAGLTVVDRTGGGTTVRCVYAGGAYGDRAQLSRSPPQSPSRKSTHDRQPEPV
jgi:PAS domain S-box-containing protein